MKKLLTSLVAIALFLGIGTAALAHSNNTSGPGNGNWHVMMDYCSEMMKSFMGNQNHVPNESSTSKNLMNSTENSLQMNQNSMNNHQEQKRPLYDDC